MRPIDLIILHCSATRPGQDIGAAEIRDWHVRERGWADIGYHFVIRRSGLIEPGRPVERAGAHVLGHNSRSIGVCLVGGHGASKDDGWEAHFLPVQMRSLHGLMTGLRGAFPGATVWGHNHFAAKGCPGFRVSAGLIDDLARLFTFPEEPTHA